MYDAEVNRPSSELADFLAAHLQPGSEELGREDEYVSVRRIILREQALNGKLKRQNWECNGAGYNAYRKILWNLKQNHSDASMKQSYSNASLSDSVLCSEEPLSKSSSTRASVASESERIAAAQPAYAFTGMKCIFDCCKYSVNVVKFGHLNSDLLAFGATNGSIYVCSLNESPRVLHHLQGHSKEVTDFDWSLSDRYLCSSSLDKGVRIWDITSGHCIRVMYDDSPQLCIRFHPVNNNFIVVGTGNGCLKVTNFSTGRCVEKLSLASNITAMDMDSSGRMLFAGDSRGCIHSITVDPFSGKLSSAHKNSMGYSRKSATTTVQFRVFSLLAGGPVLLASNLDGSLRFFSVAPQVKGYLTLRCGLHLPPHARNTKSSFCPLLSLERGEFIVSGSEDKNVYFYDFTRPKHPCVNKLQGHGAPVVGVSWNHGENYLASSDCEGVVIVWERAKLSS